MAPVSQLISQLLPDEYKKFANQLADEANCELRKAFQKKISYQIKSDGSLVTEIDLLIEKNLRAKIQQHYPKHGIIGEEFPDYQINADWIWSIDPLDGTSAFISGSPLFGFLIGLSYKDEGLYGIIDHPAQKTRWQGGLNSPTTMNKDQLCQTMKTKNINKTILYATSPHMFTKDNYKKFLILQNQCLVTRYGLDCYAYGLLASGYIDIVAEDTMKPADFLALAPVIQAAGGVISDWQGKPLNHKSDGTVLACANQAIHEKIIHLWNA